MTGFSESFLVRIFEYLFSINFHIFLRLPILLLLISPVHISAQTFLWNKLRFLLFLLSNTKNTYFLQINYQLFPFSIFFFLICVWISNNFSFIFCISVVLMPLNWNRGISIIKSGCKISHLSFTFSSRSPEIFMTSMSTSSSQAQHFILLVGFQTISPFCNIFPLLHRIHPILLCIFYIKKFSLYRLTKSVFHLVLRDILDRLLYMYSIICFIIVHEYNTNYFLPLRANIFLIFFHV